MMSRDRLLLLSRSRRNSKLPSPKARRLLSRMPHANPLNKLTLRVSHLSMIVPTLLLLVANAAEAVAVAEASVAAVVTARAAVAMESAVEAAAEASAVMAKVVAVVAAETARAVKAAKAVADVVVMAKAVAVVAAKAVVVVATEAVVADVPALLDLTERSPKELKPVADPDAIASRERHVRMLIPWIDRMVLAKLTVENAREAVEEAKADPEEMKLALMKRLRRPVLPRKRPSRLLNPNLRKKRKKLATLLMTSWLRSKLNLRVFLPKLKEDSMKRSLRKLRLLVIRRESLDVIPN